MELRELILKNMKSIIFIELFLLTLLSCKTNKIAELRENTCACFDSIKYDGDKLKFQMAEEHCITELYYGTLAIQSSFPDKSNFELNEILFNELKEKCNNWNEVMTLYFQLSKQSTDTKIKDKAQCNVIKHGRFKVVSDNNTFTLNDSVQVTNHPSGAYTFSKINWIDSCTYQVIPYETTDSIMKRHLSKNPIFTMKIIDILEDTIIFECEFNGDYSLGQFIKLK